MRRQTAKKTLTVGLQSAQAPVRDAVLLPNVLLAVVGGTAAALVVHAGHDLVLGLVGEGHMLDVGLKAIAHTRGSTKSGTYQGTGVVRKLFIAESSGIMRENLGTM